MNKKRPYYILLYFTLFSNFVSAIELPDQELLNNAINKADVSDNNISINAFTLNPRNTAAEKPFTRLHGAEIGIPHLNILSPDEFFPPSDNGRGGISSGDINKDGYVDILLATKKGIQLYINNNGKNFNRINLDLPSIENLDVYIAALVDIDNDSWIDIFLTSYATGNYYILSDQGKFSEERLKKAPTQPVALTLAIAFGDVDMDGDLDVVLGNWYYGFKKQIPTEDAENMLLINENADFIPRKIDKNSIVGDTLTVLLSDFTGDNKLDLIIGNDFEPPDYYYIGDGNGGFRAITPEDGIIPLSTDTTMSIDTGDYDNDLDLDIYVAQIAAGATGESVAARFKFRPWYEYCVDLKDKHEYDVCLDSIRQRGYFHFGPERNHSDIKLCKHIENKKERNDCIAIMLLLSATQLRAQEFCDKIPYQNQHTQYTCRLYFKPSKPATHAQNKAALPIMKNENILFNSDGNGRFTNVAKKLDTQITGWSWNAKFADFDNDQWQDIYIINGNWLDERGSFSKFFFKNENGKKFFDKTDDFGLQNMMIQTAYTETDIDNDGDLDIMASSTNGPIWFYRNNEQINNAVEFEFNDRIGNYFGIGNKLIIHYGEGQLLHQLRELKSGGGYLSFNAPIIHFGLEKINFISRIEIIWSTGERTEINGKFPANARYLITRH